MKAIEVHDLKKNYKIAKKEAGIVGSLKHLVSPRYEELPAVKGISFQIAQGESVAFLGANGAGKSTTIKMLTGIMYPSGGTIKVMGKAPFSDRNRKCKENRCCFWDKRLSFGGIFRLRRPFGC